MDYSLHLPAANYNPLSHSMQQDATNSLAALALGFLQPGSDERFEELWLDFVDEKRHTVWMEAGVRELRDHLSRYLGVVREGNEVIVTDHGKAVARLVPLDAPRPLDRLIAEGLATPGRTPKRSRSGRGIAAKGTVSDLVAEQRQ